MALDSAPAMVSIITQFFRLCSVEHNRKNWLFCDTPNGAQASAIVYTMVEMAKANGVNVYHYLTYLLEKLPNDRMRDDLRLEVIVNKSSAIEQHILDNKIDIGLIENQSEHPDIILRPFMEDKLCAIVPPDSSLASKTSITLEELALHPFLMREKGSAGREILDAYFSLKDIHIHPLWESSSTQAIVQGVAMGLGVSVLPEMMIKKDILEHRVSYLSFPKPLKRNLNLILHRNKHLTKNMKSFIEYCMLYSEK